MRKLLAGAVSAGALLLATTPAAAAPNPRACAHEPHGTEVAHATVPHENAQAHASIPHFCH